MPNEFLPKIKEFKEKYKEVNEQDLTDDDIIAMLDKHLQRDVSEGGEPDEDAENEDQRSEDVQTPENDEIEKFSESQKKQLEELNEYIAEKKKEIDKKILQIKRKKPPVGDISDKALTNKEKIKANWFEADI